MSRPDFAKEWASSRLAIPTISDQDYALGLAAYLGSQPPTTDDHDYIFNLQDKRAAWLGEQMLLAVGHEWQSDVTYDSYAVVRSPVSGQLYRSLVGGNLNNEPSVSGAQWALGVADSDDLLNTTRINIASSATVNLTTAAPDTRHINITGTAAITGFTVAAGQCYFVRFAGALTLTNGTGLVTNRGANITTAAGDTCIIRATAANTVEIVCGDFLSEAAVGARGQTWQDVTGSRSSGVTYTNTTGRPIMVLVSQETPGDKIDFFVAGLKIGTIESVSSGIPAITFVVPNGSTYQATGATFSRWSELR